MARTVFVCREDGSYQQVTDVVSVLETLVENYQDGGNYRDLFGTPLDNGPAASDQNGVFLPADGATYVALGGTATAAKISDEIAHEPPRAESRKHTRLRFYKAVTYTVSAVSTSLDTLALPGDHELDVNTWLTVASSSAVPGGLTAGTPYVVQSERGGAITLATAPGNGAINLTDAGSGTITLSARVLISEFKPGEWTSWSTTRPFRF